MADKSVQLAQNLTGIIRESVTSTIMTLFNVTVDACEGGNRMPAHDDIVCCGDLVQPDANVKLMFLFDRGLIKRLVQCAFPNEPNIGPALQEDTAMEIVNIVGNNLKMYMNIHGYKLAMELPYLATPGKTAAEQPFVQIAFSSESEGGLAIDCYLQSA